MIEHSLNTATIDEILNNPDQFSLIDVRSPQEFEDFRMPGAVNLPIFSNEERAEVGTIYKQVSEEAAKKRGIEIVSLKLPAIYEAITNLSKEHPSKQLTIYCARGGMRSRSIAVTMTMMGLPCKQAEGGIRSYRKKIDAYLSSLESSQKPIIVLEGLTGTMKTDILSALQEKGLPVVNMEKMARHKGSIFGQIGENPATQKDFEAQLFHRLRDLEESPYWMIESESKRIGRAVVPDFLLRGKYSGRRIYLNVPFRKRVSYISKLYQPENYREAIHDAVMKLGKRIAPEVFPDITSALHSYDYEEVIALLLEHYYDPRYSHAHGRYENECVEINIESIEEASEKIHDVLSGWGL
ncbi:tRNA 2-selenouridine(34) synthase MnmH [Fictibacillus iocasae]|uniref:tRNA 2-selenouridine(34) synthase MnmH n=1 Tax=Fictibacillus iocasae TaxID=2715437 RepID=A0ABW2NP85_9BACL